MADRWYTDSEGNRRRSAALDQEELDKAYAMGVAEEEAARAERIRMAEGSTEQREWDGHDADCESEYEEATGCWSPCICFDDNELPAPNAGSAS